MGGISINSKSSSAVNPANGVSGTSLATQDYVRSRLEPWPGEQSYLTLSDLALAWREMSEAMPLDGRHVLDLGCGSSPYRALFSRAASYARADIAGTPELDFTMDAETERVDAADGSFDVVVSSQVLEHVESPRLYLAEACRLLRSGGHLLLSTHGSYQDHPGPTDYWRWTRDGLEKELSGAGFAVEKILYLTTGARAALGFLELNVPHLPLARGWLMRMLSYLPRRIWVWKPFRAWMHRMADNAFSRSRVVESLPPFSGVYFILFAVARKAGEQRSEG
jgi:SAM-dependent methyltransferase